MEKEKQLLLEIKHLYNKLVNAPYGRFILGYGTQDPCGDEYKSDALRLYDKVIELNKECLRLILMNRQYLTYRILCLRKLSISLQNIEMPPSHMQLKLGGGNWRI